MGQRFDFFGLRRFALICYLVLTAVPILDPDTHAVSESAPLPVESRDILSPRGNASDVCFRYSGQSAIVNGTLYLYGGQIKTEQGQVDNTWSNDFYSLDLKQGWNIAKPALSQLAQPHGPPAVALGYLWNSHSSLYLYGGEFSWLPPAEPTPFSTWEYHIQSQSWEEHSNPQSSDGTNAPQDNAGVQRAAEGAGANVPSLGRGFYFGGHLDGYTTRDWAQWIPRVYLQSLLEFTFPGAKNSQVNALSNDKAAGTYGNYRNVTEGGLQNSGGFTDRADGLLVYVPGFGQQGVLIALAGGTNQTYTQMNNIDVYDIASSTWYKQSTVGTYPTVRVNPCAVVAAAADGSSYNIYMFGGQNLIPYDNQTQFDDMWILTVPSFTWISVDQSKQAVPYGRSGHTCNIWDGQMVMIGGYTGAALNLTCESPGVYVYDLSNLQWVQKFTSSSATAASSSSSSAAAAAAAQEDDSNPFSQQNSQLGNGTDFGGLEGSFGYKVPQSVIAVIGGGADGGATLTTPIQTATAGPMATGSAITYTVTGTGGTPVATTTVGQPNGNSGTGGSGSQSRGPNIGTIVAGVIAGLLFLLVCYLVFCTFVYRKEVQLYRNHLAMAQRQAANGEKVSAADGLLGVNNSNNSDEISRAPAHPNAVWMAGGADSNRHDSGSSALIPSEKVSGSGYNSRGDTSRKSFESEDLLDGREPTFVGVMLHPRRSLKIVNRD